MSDFKKRVVRKMQAGGPVDMEYRTIFKKQPAAVMYQPQRGAALANGLNNRRGLGSTGRVPTAQAENAPDMYASHSNQIDAYKALKNRLIQEIVMRPGDSPEAIAAKEKEILQVTNEYGALIKDKIFKGVQLKEAWSQVEKSGVFDKTGDNYIIDPGQTGNAPKVLVAYTSGPGKAFSGFKFINYTDAKTLVDNKHGVLLTVKKVASLLKNDSQFINFLDDEGEDISAYIRSLQSPESLEEHVSKYIAKKNIQMVDDGQRFTMGTSNNKYASPQTQSESDDTDISQITSSYLTNLTPKLRAYHKVQARMTGEDFNDYMNEYVLSHTTMTWKDQFKPADSGEDEGEIKDFTSSIFEAFTTPFVNETTVQLTVDVPSASMWDKPSDELDINLGNQNTNAWRTRYSSVLTKKPIAYMPGSSAWLHNNTNTPERYPLINDIPNLGDVSATGTMTDNLLLESTGRDFRKTLIGRLNYTRIEAENTVDGIRVDVTKPVIISYAAARAGEGGRSSPELTKMIADLHFMMMGGIIAVGKKKGIRKEGLKEKWIEEAGFDEDYVRATFKTDFMVIAAMKNVGDERRKQLENILISEKIESKNTDYINKRWEEEVLNEKGNAIYNFLRKQFALAPKAAESMAKDYKRWMAGYYTLTPQVGVGVLVPLLDSVDSDAKDALLDYIGENTLLGGYSESSEDIAEIKGLDIDGVVRTTMLIDVNTTTAGLIAMLTSDENKTDEQKESTSTYNKANVKKMEEISNTPRDLSDVNIYTERLPLWPK